MMDESNSLKVKMDICLNVETMVVVEHDYYAKTVQFLIPKHFKFKLLS